MARELALMGGIYQIVGILCAAIGISQTRRAWSRMPRIVNTSRSHAQRIIRSVADLVFRLFRRPPRTNRVNLTGTVHAVSTVSGKAEILIGELGVTIEEKVQWLIARVETHTNQISNLDIGSRESQANFESLRNETLDRITGLQMKTTSQIADLATGGLRLQSWGVLFLIFGAIQIMWGASINAPPNGAYLVTSIVFLCCATAMAVLMLDYDSLNRDPSTPMSENP